MKLSISDSEINFWITNLYEIWSSEKKMKKSGYSARVHMR